MMTHSEVPRTSVKQTYQLDVDDVGSVPHFTEFQQQTTNTYSRPYQAEPVYESPLTLLEDSNTERSYKSTESNGRRSRKNDIYETTNDDVSANGSCTGYCYVANTENVLPCLSASPSARDNPVSATESENDRNHVYEESFRNSRFSENAVYNNPDPYTVQGIRDINTDSAKRDWRCRQSDGKQRTSFVQICALLLSILACLIGIFALVVASGKVKLDRDEQKETVVQPEQVKAREYYGGNTEEQNDKQVLADYERMKNQVASLKQNVTDVIARNKELKKEVASSKKDFSALMAKYKELRDEVEFTKQNYSEHTEKYKNTTNQLNDFYQKLGKKIDNINLTITAKLKNVSKQMGPRGFNGTQGLQGPQGPQGKQGVGNFSACKFDQNVASTVLSSNPTHEKAEVSPKSLKTGWKVIWATCSTAEGKGAIHTVLSRENNAYKCTCAGPSKHAVFETTKQMACVIMYWACPENS